MIRVILLCRAWVRGNNEPFCFGSPGFFSPILCSRPLSHPTSALLRRIICMALHDIARMNCTDKNSPLNVFPLDLANFPSHQLCGYVHRVCSRQQSRITVSQHSPATWNHVRRSAHVCARANERRIFRDVTNQCALLVTTDFE